MSVRAARRRFLAGAASLAALPVIRAGAETEPPSATPGFDAAGLSAAAATARGFDQLHGLIVSRHGEIALAEAFRGPALDRPVNVKSVSKTLCAALAGAAIDRGVLEGVEQTLLSILGDRASAGLDPQAAEITIDHLLTMRAGLERTSGPNYGAWVASRNWVRHALTRPFVDAPGGRMLYSTGSYHLLAAALTRAAGESLLTLARRWLGAPLEIEIPPWTRDPQGVYMGGNNMALTPMALWRFGEMARQGGVWNGERVLSEAWMRASWTPRTRSPHSRDLYGYGWFITQLGGWMVYYARGYGGQMIYVAPGLGVTVAITSDPGRPARSHGYAGDLKRLMAERILPAAEAA